MPLRVPQLLNLSYLAEDRRIEIMAHRAIKHQGERVGFLVELDQDGGHSKGDRYIEKLKRRFPTLTVLARSDNVPRRGVELITIGVVH